jgi:hypothetical protein
MAARVEERHGGASYGVMVAARLWRDNGTATAWRRGGGAGGQRCGGGMEERRMGKKI